MVRMIEPESSPSDEQLIENIRSGRPEAFNPLVERYFGLVYTIAFGRLGRREAAEDLAQEVFLRAFLHLDALKPPHRFAAWVSRIARNLAANWVRDEQRRSHLTAMVLHPNVRREIEHPAQKDGRKIMETEERNNAVHAAVFRLPHQQREMILLRYVEDLNDRDIASRLDVHPSTVGRQIAKALRSMREPLETTLREWSPSVRPSRDGVARAVKIVSAVLVMTPAAKSSLAAASGGVATLAAQQAGVVGGASAADSPGFVGVFEKILAALHSSKLALVCMVCSIGVVGVIAVRSVSEQFNARYGRPQWEALGPADLQAVRAAFGDYQAICRERDIESARQIWDFPGGAWFRSTEPDIVEGWVDRIFRQSSDQLDVFAGASFASIRRLGFSPDGGHILSIHADAPQWQVALTFHKTNGAWKLIHQQVIPKRDHTIPSPDVIEEVRRFIDDYRAMSRRGEIAAMVEAWDVAWLAHGWKMSRGAYARVVERELQYQAETGGQERIADARVDSIRILIGRRDSVEVSAGDWTWQCQKMANGWKLIRQEESLREASP